MKEEVNKSKKFSIGNPILIFWLTGYLFTLGAIDTALSNSMSPVELGMSLLLSLMFWPVFLGTIVGTIATR